MANIKSAKKRVKISEKKRVNNNVVVKSMNTAIKKTNKALNSSEIKKDDKEKLIKDTIKKIDKAKAKGLIHRNKAARHKSSLARKLNTK